ncbi:glycosyltransferase [Pelobium manganitolerans]|uniref:glycosyltransferase n=1 Tax=Pelobium manganitolerans TaxID=1842495 RepID=UPI003FA3B698
MKEKSSDYILVLPSWYPSKLSISNGDFNERWVKAVAPYEKQIVIYVATKKGSQLSTDEHFVNENVITFKRYFSNSRSDLVNGIRLIINYLSVFKIVFKKYGLPKLVHNYVFFPSGIFSLYLKWKYNLKLVLTEHWSLFNEAENAAYNFRKQSIFKKLVYRLILKKFDLVIGVSEGLTNSVAKWTRKACRHYTMPNVVDVSLFYCQVKENSETDFTFIHVSSFAKQKNTLDILKAFHLLLSNDNITAKLLLIGGHQDSIDEYLFENQNIKKYVIVSKHVAYNKVAELMRSADAFVLNSDYEHMPCVILEALCCGLPVISTKVGGVAEVINNENGILINKRSPVELQNAMLQMVRNPTFYNKAMISSQAIENFSYTTIGKKTADLYKELLK